jgi:Zn finger protein HypA/HybF involved in hydrogenase expression
MPRGPRYREELETGDRIFKDQTEAIRSKYQLQHIRGRLLTKCGTCHEHFTEDEFKAHRLNCPPRSTPQPKLSTPPPPPKPKTSADARQTIRRGGKVVVRVNQQTAFCKHCSAAVLNKPETLLRHLQDNHPSKSLDDDVFSHFNQCV